MILAVKNILLTIFTLQGNDNPAEFKIIELKII